jgi:hypothetical protein
MDDSRYLYGGAAMGEIGKEANSSAAELPPSIGYLTFVLVKH